MSSAGLTHSCTMEFMFTGRSVRGSCPLYHIDKVGVLPRRPNASLQSLVPLTYQHEYNRLTVSTVTIADYQLFKDVV